MKLIEINAPFIIIGQELARLVHILTSKNPVQHFSDFAHLKLESVVEKTGRKGRTYLILNKTIFVFNSRFGPFIKI